MGDRDWGVGSWKKHRQHGALYTATHPGDLGLGAGGWPSQNHGLTTHDSRHRKLKGCVRKVPSIPSAGHASSPEPPAKALNFIWRERKPLSKSNGGRGSRWAPRRVGLPHSDPLKYQPPRFNHRLLLLADVWDRGGTCGSGDPLS